MAIQTINLTVPGGDTPRSANTKINANFSNAEHAASRLVGKSAGQIPLAQDMYSAVGGIINVTNGGTLDVDTFEIGTKRSIQSATNEPPTNYRSGGTQWMVDTFSVLYITSASGAFQMAYGRGGNKALAFRNQSSGVYTEWVNIYTTANTTVDSNGLIKPSSPVLRVFSDRIEGNADADTMQAVFTKNGVGDYTISNTTGLRTDGWYITIPNDMNGNPKVAVTLEDMDGVISLKSYKRVFSMETFTFAPDLEQPLDIPEGRWIDLRLNEIPVEPTDLGEVNP